MGGRNCCVVNCRRRSHDHRGRKIPNGLTFHCFPSWRRQEGEQISRLTESRRAAWVAAVARPDITFNQVPTSMRVCSRHFHSGKPAYEMLESDPDWVPSLHLGPSEGNTRHTERLLLSVQKGQDQNQRRPAETIPPHETEPETAQGAARPAVRPWREVKSLLHAVLRRKTNFSKQPVKKTDFDFRDFFRDALEASLEASSRFRALSGRQLSTSVDYTVELNQNCSSSSSCVNCVRLQRRNMELEEKLSRLTGDQEDIEATPVFNKAPVQPDQDLQSPETAHV
ncbi:uncharacterized protein LOC141766453 [Sebastes fasciatus]|uniref:uncharacterized protein LOC141766453 n=1 Tax=Sebastes fasciatus TaxID=394691 RepID=UPI003D9EC7B1